MTISTSLLKDVVPFALSVVSLYALDLLARHFVGSSVAESIGKFFTIILSRGWLSGYYPYLWCLCLLLVRYGIHGPSMVEPAIAASTYANAEVNLTFSNKGCTLTRFLLLVHKCLSLPYG